MSSGSSVPDQPQRLNGEPMKSGNNEEMREEYEFGPGGGVRGKYYARYTQGASVKLIFDAEHQYVANSTSSAPCIGAITRSEPYPLNAKIQIQLGSLLAPVHAG
jgi:hypothetical protein